MSFAKGSAQVSRSVVLSAGGRVVIPSEFRHALGLKEGDEVIATLTGDRIELQSRAARLRAAQDLVMSIVPPERSLVDELFAERRREAARE